MQVRDLIARCGGPSDAKAAGSLVRFPRAGEDTSDTVTIRAPTVLAEKIKAELEKQAASLRDRVVYGVVVPQSAHARLIGRGGVGVNELQKKYDIKILLPNSSWKEASNGGEVANKEELGEFADSDLIKLLGSQSACEAAATEISVSHLLRLSNVVDDTDKCAESHLMVAAKGRFCASESQRF